MNYKCITNKDWLLGLDEIQRQFEISRLCGMSVPPIMIKRIVNRLIESGLFDYKLKNS